MIKDKKSLLFFIQIVVFLACFFFSSLGAAKQEVTPDDVYKADNECRNAMYLANKQLAKLNYSDPGYADHLKVFDQAAIKHERGKYYHYRAFDPASAEFIDLSDLGKAYKAYKHCEAIAKALYDALTNGQPISIPPDIVFEELKSPSDVEIAFAGEVPITPSISQVVMLSGSDFDMGYQYAQQLSQIFGPWYLAHKAGRNFTEEQLTVLQNWERQIKQYAPEMIDFFKGWAAGASAAGIPTSYYDVLELWTGEKPPLSEMISPFPQYDHACSGSCAWGRTTTDGKLVVAGTADHDPSFQVAIVAFPETGNNYIFQPFTPNGTIELMGDFRFAGHPGMNNKGLAYWFHGGDPTNNCEPIADWGYGIRRGISIFHILRFANNADEAEAMIFSYPIGDAGASMGNAGGSWADSSGGFNIDCLKDPVAVRRAGLMGETDFLFGNNNPQHPDLGSCFQKQTNLQYPNSPKIEWHPHAGWITLGTPDFNLCRNLYFYNMFDQYRGHVDVEFMKMLYRQSGSPHPGLTSTDTYWECSSGHDANSFVAVMKPDNGDEGLYYGCTGPASRDLENIWPPGYFLVDSQYAFWELKLASSPDKVTEAAKKRAAIDMREAKTVSKKLTSSDPAYAPLNTLINRAESQFKRGKKYESLAQKSKGNEAIYNWSKASRAFMRSQVHARHAYNALVPPADSPDDLGLKPFDWPAFP